MLRNVGFWIGCLVLVLAWCLDTLRVSCLGFVHLCHLVLQEEGIADVNEMMKQERPFPERRLRGVLEDLATSCSKYGSLTQGKSSGGASAGRTKLDKERVKLCQREVVSEACVASLTSKFHLQTGTCK